MTITPGITRKYGIRFGSKRGWWSDDS